MSDILSAILAEVGRERGLQKQKIIWTEFKVDISKLQAEAESIRAARLAFKKRRRGRRK